MARRHVFDPLEPTKEPRWYEVRNIHGALLEARPLPAGSDLKRAFVAAMLTWIEAGWQLGEFSSTGGEFFCTRGAERRLVPSSIAALIERPRMAGVAEFMANALRSW